LKVKKSKVIEKVNSNNIWGLPAFLVGVTRQLAGRAFPLQTWFTELLLK